MKKKIKKEAFSIENLISQIKADSSPSSNFENNKRKEKEAYKKRVSFISEQNFQPKRALKSAKVVINID